MLTKVQKWGNSLGLRIPKALAEEASVREGSSVELTLVDGSLVIKGVAKHFELADLLAQISRENLHEEITTGGPLGRETL